MSSDDRLRQLVLEAATLSSTASALGWDQETYLPEKGYDWRARQLAWLSGRHHETVTSQAWGDTLSEAMDRAPDDERSLGNLREMKRRFDRATCLPTALVERATELSSRAKHAWAAARRDSDFAAYAPFLRELLEVSREKAERWGYPDEPYDALLETYEPGTTSAALDTLFRPLGESLSRIAEEAIERSRRRGLELPPGPYPQAAQMAFNAAVAQSIGFDLEAGRIDTTTHPFCTRLGPTDVRLTTRYNEDDFTSSLFGVMHEAGHGLYEQGLSPEDFGMPAGDSASLGIHESQSRLWENHVGRSRGFWQHWLPVAVGHFPQLAPLSLDDFLAIIHRSDRGFIRVDADEATYDLHILLRFDLERRLFRSELSVEDVPAAWNEAFHASFGTRPPNDTLGCLQDIHWSMGGFGYFPTYTLGNLNASQLFGAALGCPEVATATESADYAPLLAWLRENVHQPGATRTPAGIIRGATGSEPAAEAHLRHLRARYLA